MRKTMNKPIDEKLRILSDAAKYDVSCSSSGSSRKNTSNGLEYAIHGRQTGDVFPCLKYL